MGDLIPQFRNWLSRRIAPGGAINIDKTISSTSTTSTAPIDNTTLALSSAAVWACLRLVSQSIAALPAHIYEETDDGKVKARNHPYYSMLTKEPNALMTMSQWTQTTVLHLLLYGNAFSLPLKVAGDIVGLLPIDPTLMRIDFKSDGSFLYKLYDGTANVREFKPLDLLHFRIFSLDGIIGLAPLAFHNLTFESEWIGRAYAASIWRNGGRPSGVLEYPGTLRKEQVDAIRASWDSMHGGPENSGRVAILENGTKYAPIAVPLAQLEYVNQMKFSNEQIARIYGVPPHMIGAADKPTYASVEQQSLEFSQYTQQPIVIGLEEVIQTRLLEAPFTFRFNMNAFQRADIGTRYRAYAVGRQWGWFSVNDIRELEELNRIGPEGDVYLQPLNMIPATDPDGNPVPAPAQQGVNP